MTPKDEQDLLNYIKIMAPITLFFGGILTGLCLRFFEDIFI